MQTYLNPEFFASRSTGTCGWGCTKQDDCPQETVGRKCTKDHTTSMECTWWVERGCFCFEVDLSLLKM